MIKSARQFFLAGASALAILAGAAEANAGTVTLIGPGKDVVSGLAAGTYMVEVWGAGSGTSPINEAGGAGAEISGALSVTSGETLTLYAGGNEGGLPHHDEARTL